MPSSQNVSSHRSISLQFCLCRVHSRYTDTLHAMEENLHATGLISKFMHVLPWKRVWGCSTLQSPQNRQSFITLQVSEQIQPLCELRKETGCTATWMKPRHGQLRRPASQCLWMDLSKTSLPVSLNLCPTALGTGWSGLSGDLCLYTAEITDANSFGGKYGHLSKENGLLTSKGKYIPVKVIILHGADSHGREMLAVHFCLRT